MTKKELLKNISSEELTEWAAYFKVIDEEHETDKDKRKKERDAHERAKRQGV